MAYTLPYTYFQCPCTSETPPSTARTVGDDPTASNNENENADEDDDRTFDPRAPQANFSLYPLEHLLYCEDCQQIRCPRCVLDEIVTWYCPNCLFEVPSSTVKSEGNRCTRSCFQCPTCTSPLSVSSLETLPTGSLLGSDQAAQLGPWVLSCSYCAWSSLEIGIKFDKPNGIYNQLSKIKNGGEPFLSVKERRAGTGQDRDEGRRNMSGLTIVEGIDDDEGGSQRREDDRDPETRFANLKSFYQSQLAETFSGVGGLSFTGDYGYGSPGALSRIMGLYTGSTFGDKKSKSKNNTMREAQTASEGLVFPDLDAEKAAIQKLEKEGWESTTTTDQRNNQVLHNTRFLSDMRPVPYLLRTKRSRRCRTCRHILSKPEAKVQTTRFRIRLVAINYIPTMTIKPLSPSPAPPPPTPLTPSLPSSLPTVATAPLLQPLKPTQFLLTLRNPLFDPIKITLATPTQTPGRFASKVTILCPQFEVGANTDMWDEALAEGGGGGKTERERKKSTTAISGTADGQTAAGSGVGQSGQAEAGKVWERGRNWSTVVVEVVPASLDLGVEKSLKALKLKSETGEGKDQPQLGSQGENEDEDDMRILEDEDVLEIPVFVRVEWETDAAGDDATGGAGAGAGGGREKTGDLGAREKRELAYWCVLGVGKIARN